MSLQFDRLMDKLLERPDRRVLAYQGRELFERTFLEVHGDVARAIEDLERAGVEARMRVGILAGNCYEWAVYDLALLHMNVVVVGLTEEVVSEGVEAARERYGLSLLLVDADTPGALGADLPWVGQITGLAPLSCHVVEGAAREDNEDSLSWVFSSGSTGRLKCMSVSRKNAGAIFERLPGDLGGFRGEGDMMLLFLPFSHFQQRGMIYVSIWHGYEIVIATPKLLFAALEQARPTYIVAPPLFYEMIHRRIETMPGLPGTIARSTLALIEALPEGQARRLIQRVCSQPVRAALGGRPWHLVSGMAPIRPSTLKLFTLLDLPIYEGYGMTEVGLVATNRPGRRREGSVGMPPDPARVRLAEDGEVQVKGDAALTSGYLFHDPEDARKTYLEDGWIATGDVGRFDDEGFLYLVGRKKVMIMTPGGDKLHPEELERHLNQCPGVIRSMVCSVGGPRLVAVVSVTSDSPKTRAAVDRCVEELNLGRAVQLQIGRVIPTQTEFTLDNELLTRSLKLNRAGIRERFVDQEVRA